MRISKKTIAVFLTTFLMTAVVHADIGIESYSVDNEKNIFSVKYSYLQNESASIIVYDVSKIDNPTINTEYVDMEQTPIIAIEQELGDGRFDLAVKSDYTGRVMLLIGSSDGSFDRILLKIDNGSVRSIVIPSRVSSEIDADGLVKYLSENETLVIDQSGMLKNAVVDANLGNIIIGTTDVKGKVKFDLDGKITVDIGDSITLESEMETVTKDDKSTYQRRNVGFIKGVSFDNPADKRTVKVLYGEKAIEREYTTTGMMGNFVFGIAVKGVPETVSADDFTVTIE